MYVHVWFNFLPLPTALESLSSSSPSYILACFAVCMWPTRHNVCTYPCISSYLCPAYAYACMFGVTASMRMSMTASMDMTAFFIDNLTAYISLRISHIHTILYTKCTHADSVSFLSCVYEHKPTPIHTHIHLTSNSLRLLFHFSICLANLLLATLVLVLVFVCVKEIYAYKKI